MRITSVDRFDQPRRIRHIKIITAVGENDQTDRRQPILRRMDTSGRLKRLVWCWAILRDESVWDDIRDRRLAVP